MGAGESASPADVARAEELGERLAREGWVVLTGGRDAGVMAAASRGAKKVPGSLTVGLLPSESVAASPHLDVALYTGLGLARNAVNVLSSRVVVACGVSGPGTASEVALALKAGRPVVLLAPPPEAEGFFRTLGGALFVAATPEEAVEVARSLLDVRAGRHACS